MRLLLSVIVIFLSVDCYAQTILKEEEFKIHNQVKVIKSYVEPWNSTGIRLVNIDSTQLLKKHSCSSSRIGEPLWLVDEKIMEAGYINKLNPNEIQSVEVLKGKSATDKYGEKAKHGAILITMKCKEETQTAL